MNSSRFSPRHCERSEAIQGRKALYDPWIASELTLLAMTAAVESNFITLFET
jgi:hypothetical protein